MRTTDIAIAGGGLAGSTAAAMLGRAGFDVVLIDPHKVYPPDLRCEKIDGPQLRMLHKTGLADAVLRAATYDGEAWVARFGRLVEKRRGRPARHSLRHAGQYDSRRDPARRCVLSGQGAGDLDQCATADAHAIDRRADFRTAGYRGERTQYGSAPNARHGARGYEPLPFPYDRVRPRAGRPRQLRLRFADLLSRAHRRPHGVPVAVSDRPRHARQLHGLPRPARPLAAQARRTAAKRRCSPACRACEN